MQGTQADKYVNGKKDRRYSDDNEEKKWDIKWCFFSSWISYKLNYRKNDDDIRKQLC
jgi:hypothetical protein